MCPTRITRPNSYYCRITKYALLSDYHCPPIVELQNIYSSLIITVFSTCSMSSTYSLLLTICPAVLWQTFWINEWIILLVIH
jgi:hypothetical protein